MVGVSETGFGWGATDLGQSTVEANPLWINMKTWVIALSDIGSLKY